MKTQVGEPQVFVKKRPWAGVLFSLFIPGFGIARAGHLGWAVAWFLGIEIGVVLVGLCFALEAIPFDVGVAGAACLLFGFLGMLYQSYRPGRMTGKLWAGFIGVCALTLITGSAWRLLVRPFKISTASMRPTLRAGDHMFVDRLTYRFSSPRRGDLLVFRTQGMAALPQDQIYVKRIVGMPGERLEIRDGAAFANGNLLTETDGVPPIRFTPGFAAGQTGAKSDVSYEVALGSFFVVGDNTDNSFDSRQYGCVPVGNVYGKVSAIYYPFSRAGRPKYTGEPDRAANRGHPVGAESNRKSVAGPGR